jgi:hypothetical protein
MFHKNEKFIKIMGAICWMYWSKNNSLGVMLIETGFLEWEGTIKSYKIDDDAVPDDEYDYVPEDLYDFVINVLDEKHPIPQQNLRSVLSIGSCKECYDELLSPNKLTLPINIIIGHDQIRVRDNKNVTVTL